MLINIKQSSEKNKCYVTMNKEVTKLNNCFYIFNTTRRLDNVRSHMMFRPELIHIFDLLVIQMKR